MCIMCIKGRAVPWAMCFCPLRGVLLRLLHTPSFFAFSHSTFHPKHLTLNPQHSTLFKRTPFAFQNESFYPSKGVLLHSKTSPFESQKDSFCFIATFFCSSGIWSDSIMTLFSFQIDAYKHANAVDLGYGT